MPALSFPSSSGLTASDDSRLSRVEAALPVARAGRTLYSPSGLRVPADEAVLDSGQISPTSGIAATGNTFPFVTRGVFGFAWNGGTLTICWDGTNGSTPFVIRRADGSSLSVPKGSIAISGLQPATVYSFAPFVSTAQAERVSFVLGNVGSPRYAFSPAASYDTLTLAAQTQRLTTNERLTDGLITYTTGDGSSASTGKGSATYTGNPSDPDQTNPGYNPN